MVTRYAFSGQRLIIFFTLKVSYLKLNVTALASVSRLFDQAAWKYQSYARISINTVYTHPFTTLSLIAGVLECLHNMSASTWLRMIGSIKLGGNSCPSGGSREKAGGKSLISIDDGIIAPNLAVRVISENKRQKKNWKNKITCKC